MAFVDTHPLSAAFLGYRLGRLYDLIARQGDEFMHSAGLSFPSRANSTIMLIDESENISVADITIELDQPHQLVAQRIELLMELGLVVKKPDPYDGRRKILILTKKGKQEVALLRQCLADAARAFSVLFDEIGVDLNELADCAKRELENTPLDERVNAVCNRKNKSAAAT